MRKFKVSLSFLLVLTLISTTILGQASFATAKANELPKAHIAKGRDKTEIIVKFRESAVESDVINSVKRKHSINKLVSKEKFKKSRLELIEIGSNDDINTVIQALRGNIGVEFAQPNYELTVNSIPTDPKYNEQWGLTNVGQVINGQAGYNGVDINAAKAWEISTGSNVLVGVLDSGIDINHSDLSPNIYLNTNEIPHNGVDDDNNGYIDDIYGWDFINNDNTVFDSSAQDTHGTHVAGIISAASNSQGVTSLAYQAKILPLKFINGSVGYTFDVIEALEYAKSIGVKIINCSWGGTEYNPALRDAMLNSGMFFVCAAGNNNSEALVYPAGFDLGNTISIAAIDNKGQLAYFSNYGEKVQLAAPGVDIISTLPGDSYGYMSGTSMAAPYVSAVSALLLSQQPNLPVTEMKAHLEAATTVVPMLKGKLMTAGIINAYKVLGGVDSDGLPEIIDDTNTNEQPSPTSQLPIDAEDQQSTISIPLPGVEGEDPGIIVNEPDEHDKTKDIPEIEDQDDKIEYAAVPIDEASNNVQIKYPSENEIQEIINRPFETPKIINIVESLEKHDLLHIYFETDRNVKAEYTVVQYDESGYMIESPEKEGRKRNLDLDNIYLCANHEFIDLNSKTKSITYKIEVIDEYGNSYITDDRSISISSLSNDAADMAAQEKLSKLKQNSAKTDLHESQDTIDVQAFDAFDTMETAKYININEGNVVCINENVAYNSLNSGYIANNFAVVPFGNDLMDYIDEDWYMIYVSKPTALTFYLTLQDNCDLNLLLYDENGILLAASNSSTKGASEYISYNFLTTGYYYIMVQPAYSFYPQYSEGSHIPDAFLLFSDGGSYSLNINNIIASEAINSGRYIDSFINGLTDSKWFKINIDENMKTYIELDNIPTNSNYGFEVYGAKNNTNAVYIGGSVFTPDNSRTSFCSVASPTNFDYYFIKVFSYNGYSSTSPFRIIATQYKADEYELNESSLAAKNVDFNQVISASIDNPLDTDWFKININERTKLNFKLQNIPSDCDYDIAIFDSSLNNIAGGYNGIGVSENFYSILNPGIYYIYVCPRRVSFNQYINYNLIIHNYSPDSYELNENYYTAKQIDINDTITATLDNNADYDWYRISLDKASKVIINLGNVPESYFYNMNVYNSSMTWQKGMYVGTGTSRMLSLMLDAGVYYVLVNSYNGCVQDAQYNLTISYVVADQYELNEGNSTAALTEADSLITGTIDNLYDQDWYKFTVDQKKKVYLKLVNSIQSEDYKIAIYNSSLKRLTEYIEQGNVNDIIMLFEQGEYYIQIYSSSGYSQTDEYTLSLESFVPDLLELNENDSSATNIFVGQIISASIDNPLDMDWYKIYIDSNGLLNICLANIPDGVEYNIDLFNSLGELLISSIYTSNIAANIEYLVRDDSLYYVKVTSTNIGEFNNEYEMITSISQLVDNEPPSVPTGLISTTKTESTINLLWNESEDNLSDIEYNVYINDTFFAKTKGTNYSATSLNPNSTYTFYITCNDETGNFSGPSNVLIEETLIQSTITGPDTVSTGDFFDIQLGLIGAMDITTFDIDVTYDKDKIDLTNVTTLGDVLTIDGYSNDAENGIIKLVLRETGGSISGNSDILNLTFRSKSAGESDISLFRIKCATENGELEEVMESRKTILANGPEIPYSVSDYKILNYYLAGEYIEIQEFYPPDKIDFNGDSKVDINDLDLIAENFMVGQNDDRWTSLRDCDLNNDGILDLYEIVVVARYLLGMGGIGIKDIYTNKITIRVINGINKTLIVKDVDHNTVVKTYSLSEKDDTFDIDGLSPKTKYSFTLEDDTGWVESEEEVVTLYVDLSLDDVWVTSYPNNIATLSAMVTNFGTASASLQGIQYDVFNELLYTMVYSDKYSSIAVTSIDNGININENSIGDLDEVKEKSIGVTSIAYISPNQFKIVMTTNKWNYIPGSYRIHAQIISDNRDNSISNNIKVKSVYVSEMSSSELDYGYGSITVKGKRVPIYVPRYSNGTNFKFSGDGWVTLDDESLRLFYRDTNWAKFITDIGSIHGEECAAVKVDLNEIVYLNGSKSGRVGDVGTYQSPLIATLVLGAELLASYNANTTYYFLTVAIQKNGDKYRAVLQLESTKNPMQQYAGQSYYHLEANYLYEPGRFWGVMALKDKLTELGYGEYVKGDAYTNIYVTMDSAHEYDASLGYLSLKNGLLMITPKIYANDSMKIVNNTEFLGLCTGHEVKLDITEDMKKTVVLGEHGLLIVEKAAYGDVIFNR